MATEETEPSEAKDESEETDHSSNLRGCALAGLVLAQIGAACFLLVLAYGGAMAGDACMGDSRAYVCTATGQELAIKLPLYSAPIILLLGVSLMVITQRKSWCGIFGVAALLADLAVVIVLHEMYPH